MDRNIANYLIKNSINPSNYVVVKKTCDNIILRNKINNKRLDVRW